VLKFNLLGNEHNNKTYFLQNQPFKFKDLIIEIKYTTKE